MDAAQRPAWLGDKLPSPLRRSSLPQHRRASPDAAAAADAAAIAAASAAAAHPGLGRAGALSPRRTRGRARSLEFTPPLAALREEPSPSPDKVPPLQPSPGAAGVLLHPSTSNPFAEICVAAAALPAPGAHDAADGGAPAPAPLEHTAGPEPHHGRPGVLGYAGPRRAGGAVLHPARAGVRQKTWAGTGHAGSFTGVS